MTLPLKYQLQEKVIEKIKEAECQRIKEEINKILDNALKSSFYVGIGHWTTDYDIEAVNNGLARLKQEISRIFEEKK